MFEYVREAGRIYRQKGGFQLIRESIQFLRNLPIELFYVAKEYKSLTVADVTVEVSIPDRSAVRSVRFARESEYELMELLVNELQPEDVFLDVGSHIGIIAGFVSEAEPDSRVIAVEPYPPNVEALRETAKRSGGAPIEIIQQPLSDTREEISLSTPDLPGTRGLSSIAKNVGGSSINVESITGDELVNSGRIPQPNIIKIDVEGAEGKVIDGLKETLKSPNCRLVICEVHLTHSDEDSDVYLAKIESKLDEAGFQTSILHDRSMEVQIIARRPEAE